MSSSPVTIEIAPMNALTESSEPRGEVLIRSVGLRGSSTVSSSGTVGTYGVERSVSPNNALTIFEKSVPVVGISQITVGLLEKSSPHFGGLRYLYQPNVMEPSGVSADNLSTRASAAVESLSLNKAVRVYTKAFEKVLGRSHNLRISEAHFGEPYYRMTVRISAGIVNDVNQMLDAEEAVHDEVARSAPAYVGFFSLRYEPEDDGA